MVPLLQENGTFREAQKGESVPVPSCPSAQTEYGASSDLEAPEQNHSCQLTLALTLPSNTDPSCSHKGCPAGKHTAEKYLDKVLCVRTGPFFSLTCSCCSLR